MNKKKITRDQIQSAQQIMGILSALTPGLQQVEGQLKQVAEITPTLQYQWEQNVQVLRDSIEDLRTRHDQMRTTFLTLFYLMGTNAPAWQDLLVVQEDEGSSRPATIEEFFERVNNLQRNLCD